MKGKYKSLGVIHYLGTPQYRAMQGGYWIGVHLHKPVGNCNGTVHNQIYFRCPENHGIIVRSTLITLCRETYNLSQFKTDDDDYYSNTEQKAMYKTKGIHTNATSDPNMISRLTSKQISSTVRFKSKKNTKKTLKLKNNIIIKSEVPILMNTHSIENEHGLIIQKISSNSHVRQRSSSSDAHLRHKIQRSASVYTSNERKELSMNKSHSASTVEKKNRRSYSMRDVPMFKSNSSSSDSLRDDMKDEMISDPMIAVSSLNIIHDNVTANVITNDSISIAADMQPHTYLPLERKSNSDFDISENDEPDIVMCFEKRYIISEWGWPITFLILDKNPNITIFKEQLIHCFGHVEILDNEQIIIREIDNIYLLMRITFHDSASIQRVKNWKFFWKKKSVVVKSHGFKHWKNLIDVQYLYPVFIEYLASWNLDANQVRRWLCTYCQNLEDLLQNESQIVCSMVDSMVNCTVYFANEVARDKLLNSKYVSLKSLHALDDDILCEWKVDELCVVMERKPKVYVSKTISYRKKRKKHGRRRRARTVNARNKGGVECQPEREHLNLGLAVSNRARTPSRASKSSSTFV